MNIRVLSNVHGVEIVFINITDDPDIGQIRDGEGIWRAQSLDSRRVRYLLVGDDTRYRCDDVDDSGRVLLIDAQKPQLLSCVIQVRLGILFGNFSSLKRALLDSALIIKNLRSLQLCTR